jgi:4-amino-4-deoxy-L-arabinose transferase-like glycosyltransferase
MRAWTATASRASGVSVTVLGLVTAVGLLVRLSLMSADSAITPGDGPVYFALAHSLVEGRGMDGNDFRTPGYPLIVAVAVLADKLVGSGEADLLLAAQDLVALLLIPGAILVGARFFGAVAGVATGLLIALSPAILMLERITYPDLVFAVALFSGAAVLAEALVRDGDRRLLVLTGVLFGASAYVKPVAQPLVLAAFLALLISTRSIRRAFAGGIVAAAAMLLVMAPWLVGGALGGSDTARDQSGITLFHRVFEDDGRPVPTDTPYGPLMRSLQLRGPSVHGDRLWARVHGALLNRRLRQDEAALVMRKAAIKAIRRDVPAYLIGTADDLRQSVRDLAASRPEGSTEFAFQDRLRAEFRRARIAFPPRGITWAAVQLGLILSTLWLVVSLHGAAGLLLPFASDLKVRAAGAAFLTTWLIVALSTSFTHGALWRYSAGLAPLGWLAGSAGAVLLASAVRGRMRSLRGHAGT